MKKTLVRMGLVVMAAVFGLGAKAASKSVTLTGEVLDMACYMGHGASGEKHAECAKMCLQGGAPAGLLQANGKVMLLVENHEADKTGDIFKKVRALGGEKATVTGPVQERGGVKALLVEKVEPAK